MIDQWLGVVRAIRPECPARITPDGQALKIAHGTPVVPAGPGILERFEKLLDR